MHDAECVRLLSSWIATKLKQYGEWAPLQNEDWVEDCKSLVSLMSRVLTSSASSQYISGYNLHIIESLADEVPYSYTHYSERDWDAHAQGYPGMSDRDYKSLGLDGMKDERSGGIDNRSLKQQARIEQQRRLAG